MVKQHKHLHTKENLAILEAELRASLYTYNRDSLQRSRAHFARNICVCLFILTVSGLVVSHLRDLTILSSVVAERYNVHR